MEKRKDTRYVGAHMPQNEADAFYEQLKKHNLDFSKFVREVGSAVARGDLNPRALVNLCTPPEALRAAEAMRKAMNPNQSDNDS